MLCISKYYIAIFYFGCNLVNNIKIRVGFVFGARLGSYGVRVWWVSVSCRFVSGSYPSSCLVRV